MSRYDGLIIPRSYSEYINKTDAATLLQALQQSGVMDAAPTAGSNHPVKSGGVAATMEMTETVYTPKVYQDRVTFSNNSSKYYKIGNHIKIHIDVTVTQVNVTVGMFAFNIIDLTPRTFPIAIYYMSGIAGIGLTDSSAISGLIWLKDSTGAEISCTSLLNKRIWCDIDFFI